MQQSSVLVVMPDGKLDLWGSYSRVRRKQLRPAMHPPIARIAIVVGSGTEARTGNAIAVRSRWNAPDEMKVVAALAVDTE